MRFERAAAIILAIALGFGIPIARSQFGGPSTFAGTAAGTANAQTITLANVSSYADLVGIQISYVAANTNTGLTTLNVNSFGTKNVMRPVPAGLAGLGGGEIVTGALVQAEYDGTQFHILNSARPEMPGALIDYSGASCPVGTFAASSATQAQASYPALFAVLGATWGSSGGGNFTLPDLRNRTTYGQDINVGGLSNRITTAGGNFDGTVIAAAGATQNYTLGVTQIPAHNHPVTDPGHNHGTVGLTSIVSTGAGAGTNPQYVNSTGGTTASNTTGISIGNTGGGLSHPTLSPGAIVNKCVRA